MIDLNGVSISAGHFALGDVFLHVATGQYGVLMGQSGCGKTTLLEAICGLRPIDAGTICIDGSDVTRRRPAERGVGYVPQDGALFTTMRVEEQLAYALVIRHWSRAQIAERIAELAQLLQIETLLKRLPDRLSGGEAQRVAIGRALACRPGVLLLDEPLVGLDDDTRRHMIDLLRIVQQSTGATILHVTHSFEDMDALAERLWRIDEGRVSEVARA